MQSKTFTLTVNNEPVSPADEFPTSYLLDNFLSRCDIAMEEKGKLLTRTNPQNTVYPSFGNSFIGSLWDAYSGHYKLVLRPDDLWLTIVIAFAGYVDYHAEEMRHYFVTHEGKKDLIIDIVGTTSTVDWDHVIKMFSDLINENTTGGIRDWIEPKFSTTTPNDSLIARVALMGVTKHYFAPKLTMRCGIPEVTLLGTLDDWQDLRTRVDRFSQFDEQPFLIWWHKILIPIIDKFIDSYNGNVDNDFWQSCANRHSGGSEEATLTGWALAFSPFCDGNWHLNHPDDILLTGSYGEVPESKLCISASTKVPLKVDDHGRLYDAYFYAGGFLSKYEPETGHMSPSFDFAMFEVASTKTEKVRSVISIESTDPTLISNVKLNPSGLHLHRSVQSFHCKQCSKMTLPGIAYKSLDDERLFCLKCVAGYATLLVDK